MLLLQNDGSRFFAINPTSGVLTVKETLDYEGLNQNKLYSIQVQASVSKVDTTHLPVCFLNSNITFSIVQITVILKRVNTMNA